MKSHAGLRTLAYYLSQYLWLLYIVIPVVCSIIFPKLKARVLVHSSKTQFNNSENPIVFAHITDSHINTIRPESIMAYSEMVRLIKAVSPEFIIHTGDMVDNYDSLSMLRYGDQDERSWVIYKDQMRELSDIPIIEMAGNHDMFGIKSVLSHKNHIIDYSYGITRQNTRNDEDFIIKSYHLGSAKTNIITINPFKFPTAHPPLHLYVRYSKHLLDRLEHEIQKSHSKSIIAGHFPVGSIHSKKSSSGKRFTDIIGSDDSVLAYLSGHSHPVKPDVFHHGKGGVEILGPASFINSKFGVVTIDNHGIAWSMIDTTNPQKGVLSYPVPKKQISKNVIFNDRQNTSIRVIMFSNQINHSIHFTLKKSSKNVFSGTLNYTRNLPRGQTLYSFPIKDCIKEDGSYTITFSGDFNGSTEFLIGETFKTSTAILTEYPKLVESLTITFPVFLAILFIVTIIIPFNCCQWQTKLDSLEVWVETGEGNDTYWVVPTLFGFLLMRARFQRVPLYIKIFVFLMILYSFCGPLLFFMTEDLIGFVWPYGYYIDKHNIPADYGIFYAYLYVGAVCFPTIVLCSSFGVRKWNLKQLADVIVYIAGVVVNILVLLRLVHETVGTRMTFTSIGFFIIPIMHIVLMCVWIFYLRKFDRMPLKKIKKNLSLKATMSNIESKYMKTELTENDEKEENKLDNLDNSDDYQEPINQIHLNPL